VPDFQSEDCLNLNVYTPKLGARSAKDALPVLLFFHGCGLLSSMDALVA
jgi:carboxylesterase type B